MKATVLLFLSILLVHSGVHAQGDPEAQEKEKNVNLLLLPVVASNPATGFMFGVAPSANWLMGHSLHTGRKESIKN